MVLLCCVLLASALVFLLFLCLLPLWCRVFWLLVGCWCWCSGFVVCWVLLVLLCFCCVFVFWLCGCVRDFVGVWLLRVARVLLLVCVVCCVSSGCCSSVGSVLFWVGPLFCGPPGVGCVWLLFCLCCSSWLLLVFWLVVVVVLLCPLFCSWLLLCVAPSWCWFMRFLLSWWFLVVVGPPPLFLVRHDQVRLWSCSWFNAECHPGWVAVWCFCSWRLCLWVVVCHPVGSPDSCFVYHVASWSFCCCSLLLSVEHLVFFVSECCCCCVSCDCAVFVSVGVYCCVPCFSAWCCSLLLSVAVCVCLFSVHFGCGL